ncbi:MULTISPECIES: hypothetical protein [unclassified Pseudactinotalea]|uniref:hypothetical protein n=2 Tax=unclassified Pseudactinotalea TaxID=2649176 RepID=UPI0018923760|nr:MULTISPECIES: hypothetical protein [unclassified Pseudactinotalea]
MLRLAFLVPAGLAMLAGLNAALLLLGVPAPVQAPAWADLHGILMVGGFLGTLICLERAVALRQAWAFCAPALLGVGALLLLTPLPALLGQLFLVEGVIGFIAIYLALWRRNHDDVVLVQLLGAVHLLIPLTLWIWLPLPWIMPWLVGFLVLTIGAERVELARLAMPATGGRTLVLAATALTLTITATLPWPAWGARATGLVLGLFVIWLVRHDLARTLVRSSGLPRFSAAALLAGYAWLLVAAAAWLVAGDQRSGALYDLVVHSVMLGFAISMVMAHAPIILPAVLRRPLPYRAVMWAPLALLHAGLVVRVAAGDLAGITAAWRAGSVVNVIALLLFVGVAATSSLLGPRARPEPAPRARATRAQVSRPAPPDPTSSIPRSDS